MKPKQSTENTNICCFCGKEIKGYGNNAEPLKHDICCDECNQMIVLPERIYRWYRRNRK